MPSQLSKVIAVYGVAGAVYAYRHRETLTAYARSEEAGPDRTSIQVKADCAFSLAAGAAVWPALATVRTLIRSGVAYIIARNRTELYWSPGGGVHDE